MHRLVGKVALFIINDRIVQLLCLPETPFRSSMVQSWIGDLPASLGLKLCTHIRRVEAKSLQ